MPRRSAAIISSLISTRRAPTSRITDVLSGKIPTTSVHRWSSRLSRSISGCSTRSSTIAPGEDPVSASTLVPCLRAAQRPPRMASARPRRAAGGWRCQRRAGRTRCAPAQRSSPAAGEARPRAACASRAGDIAARQHLGITSRRCSRSVVPAAATARTGEVEVGRAPAPRGGRRVADRAGPGVGGQTGDGRPVVPVGPRAAPPCTPLSPAYGRLSMRAMRVAGSVSALTTRTT